MANNPDLTTFLSNVKVKNLARKVNYRVDIDIPRGLYNVGEFINLTNPSELANTLSFFCYFAAIPSVGINSNGINIGGAEFQIPDKITYDRFYLGMYLDQDYFVKAFFDAWRYLICEEDSYLFGFREEYITNIRISQLDQQMQPVYTVELREVHPIYVEPISLNYSDKNSVSTLTTMFAYKEWKNIYQSSGHMFDEPNSILGMIPGLIMKGYNIYQFVKKINRKY